MVRLLAVNNFLIIAFAVFMLVRYVKKVKVAATKKEEAAPEPEELNGPTELEVFLEIRDSLKK
jgi:large conductance mechanosensitive channel